MRTAEWPIRTVAAACDDAWFEELPPAEQELAASLIKVVLEDPAEVFNR